ncbi:MAG: hypothetical protein LRY55_03560 [Leadbetterella sp.]|nr:hypothetical protein [Leadbetterella sp.]
MWKNEFKGNEKVYKEELELIIPFAQRENSKPLSLPFTPRVWWYNFGQNTFDSLKFERKRLRHETRLAGLKENPGYSLKKAGRIERRIDRYQNSLANKIAWFYSNIGEKQVYISEEEAEETAGAPAKVSFRPGLS